MHRLGSNDRWRLVATHQIELRDELLQLSSLGGQRFGRARELFGLGGVGLRDLIHLRHRLIDLIDATGLLAGSSRNLRNDIRHAFDRRDDLVEGLAGLV